MKSEKRERETGDGVDGDRLEALSYGKKGKDSARDLDRDRQDACPTVRLWTFSPKVSAACWRDIYGQAT
jgi:hypothetical protein